VEGGMKLKEIVKFCLKEGLTGLEWAAGIPGTLGGAVYGNASAFGNSMSDLVEKVEVFDVQKEKIRTFEKKDCQFGLKESIFKKQKRYILISAVLKLKKGKKKEIKEKIKYHLDYREKNHPLNFPSAGSIFKNKKLKIKNKKLLKAFPKLREFNKKGEIPAGYLIEKSGLKGKRIGGAEISKKHANFIVNLGKAKAEDVLRLINLVKKEVKNKFGISLEEEIQYLTESNKVTKKHHDRGYFWSDIY
jgi:UDP-N-acetylmuramate dehydrogenase